METPNPYTQNLYAYLAERRPIARGGKGTGGIPYVPPDVIDPSQAPTLPARYRRKGAIRGLIALATLCSVALTVDKGGTFADAIACLQDSLRYILPSYNSGQRQMLATKWLMYFV